MIESIRDDIKKTFQYGNMVSKILIINIAVFVVVLLLNIFLKTAGTWYSTIINNLAISSEPMTFLFKPWTFISHMFLHEGFWHLIWNMLIFYWFGRITGDLIGDNKILPIYIYGGLVGALAFILSFKLLGLGGGIGIALGASAAVMAIVMVAAMVAPDYNMRLLLLGDVKIKYIALALILMDLVGTAGDVNTGGSVAHLGGMLYGAYFVYALRKGHDLSIGFNAWFDKLQSLFNRTPQPKKSPLKVKYKSKDFGRQKGSRAIDDGVPFQEQLDRILEKIKEDGYEKLSDEEKEFLFQASKK